MKKGDEKILFGGCANAIPKLQYIINEIKFKILNIYNSVDHAERWLIKYSELVEVAGGGSETIHDQEI